MDDTASSADAADGAGDAADVFGLLSDGIRVDILREIAIARSEGDRLDPGAVELSFSTLYDRVDVDGTSKLSYHLGELEGAFLRKSDDGYSFTHAGERIVRLILSENYGSPAAIEPTETPGVFPFCGAEPLEASLHHQYLRIACPDCERGIAGYQVTPAQVRDRSSPEVVESFKHRMIADYRQVGRGLCPECGGRVSLDVVETERPEPSGDGPENDGDGSGTLLLAIDHCGACLRTYSMPVTIRLAYHPASVAFHWERGVDVLSKPPWELFDRAYGGRWAAERVGTDPAAYEITLRAAGDELRLSLGPELSVERSERVRRRSAANRSS